MSIVSQALFLDKLAVKADVTLIAKDIIKQYGTTQSPEAQRALLAAYNRANLILRAQTLPKGWDIIEARYPGKLATMTLRRKPNVTSQEVLKAGEAWKAKARKAVYDSFPWYKDYRKLPVQYPAAIPYDPKPVFNVTPHNYYAWKMAKASAKDPNAEEYLIKMAETNLGKKPLPANQMTLFDIFPDA